MVCTKPPLHGSISIVYVHTKPLVIDPEKKWSVDHRFRAEGDLISSVLLSVHTIGQVRSHLKMNLVSVRVSIRTLFLSLLVTVINSQAGGDQERSVLLNLKRFWQDPAVLDQWNDSSPSPSPVCSWPFVTCTGGSVTGLSFYNLNITGTVPGLICDLKNLTSLDLSFNFMAGEFPTVLYNCSKLQHLNLSMNNFAGKLPGDIDRLSGLRSLGLYANYFSGDIPAGIGRLSRLTYLQLHQNPFNGTFPPEIGNLSDLEILYMSYIRNFVPSSLPQSFVRLKKLKVLSMSNSNLIGEIPEGVGNWTELQLLDLSNNNLTGKLPGDLFKLKNLSEVYLFMNRLSGEIPQAVEAGNLSVLDLSENNLTGKIPDGFGKLQKLEALNLIFNQLSGEVPEEIGRLPALRVLRLFNNNFSGTIPPDLGLYSGLQEFQVSSNGFSGSLPENLCHGGVLAGVVASDNNLAGEFPGSLGNCSSLTTVRVENNNLSGTIPDGLWTLPRLQVVLLSNNSVDGELPGRLSANLSLIEISDNRFSGDIGARVSNWTNLVVFKASNNLFTGTLPTELTALPLITTLLLDGNRFSGELPSEIVSWKKLVTLNLSRNQLSGQIPDQFASLSGISELDLSGNRLSGQIPPELGRIRFTSLNLSSNNLVGTIPSELENGAYDASFLDNPGLCARSPLMNIEICNANPENSTRISRQFLALALSLGLVALLLALLSSFFVARLYWRRKRGTDSWKLTSFQKLSFTESNILSGLTESNLIGKGGSGKVYRVPLPRSREVVAVKKIWNNRKVDQKLEEEFAAEVKTLSTIRHSNIVKLMCSISSESSRLLVYEFLENRSLDTLLHRRSSSSSTSAVHDHDHAVLDWPRRLRIAVGAAQGLCYMHHDCSPPIVHRDVKSSNILLDSQFNAKIADFGLAKMLVRLGEAYTMSAVAGSFGYIAPEYGHTRRVSEKVDVYSFGVVLLELATGREANQGGEDTSLAEWAWQHLQDGKPVEDALDSEAKEARYLDEMSTVFKVGIICTGTLPSSRPTMKEVLQILLRSNQTYGYGIKKAVTPENDTAPLFRNSRHEHAPESDSDSSGSEV